MPSYIAPYRGRDRGLPAGFMEAATMPGRIWGASIQDFAESITKAVEQRDSEVKAEGLAAKSAEFLRKSLEESAAPGVKVPSAAEFGLKSARDKIAWGQGILQAQTIQQAATQQKQSAERHQAFLDQVSAAKRREALEDQDRQGIERFHGLLQSRTRLPEGHSGPVQPLDDQAVLGALADSGTMFNPQADNVLNALAKARDLRPRPSAGVPGTITTTPDGRKFGWMSEGSGKFLDEPGTSVSVTTSSVPEGHEVWTDNQGKQHLVKKSDPKASPAVEQKRNLLGLARAHLMELQELQARGAKYVARRPDGTFEPAGWFRGDHIQEMIQATERRLRNIEIEIDAMVGAPSAGPASAAPAATPAAPETEMARKYKEFIRARGGGQ